MVLFGGLRTFLVVTESTTNSLVLASMLSWSRFVISSLLASLMACCGFWAGYDFSMMAFLSCLLLSMVLAAIFFAACFLGGLFRFWGWLPISP